MLGPLVFPLYINDLQQAVLKSTVAMYADDTSLSYQFDDFNDLAPDYLSDLFVRNSDTTQYQYRFTTAQESI